MGISLSTLKEESDRLNGLKLSLVGELRSLKLVFPSQNPVTLTLLILLWGFSIYLVFATVPSNFFYFPMVIIPAVLAFAILWSMSDFPQENIKIALKIVDLKIKLCRIKRKQRLLSMIINGNGYSNYDDLLLELSSKTIGEPDSLEDVKINLDEKIFVEVGVVSHRT
ncbi:MAG TPA: hypothetical protein P5106_01695 [Caldisericia bacterium]|nr:hypothetical protein [Caldisericia bacterium]